MTHTTATMYLATLGLVPGISFRTVEAGAQCVDAWRPGLPCV